MRRACVNLQMMDIEDAGAKDATVQSMAADQATTKMLQTAQRIEDEAQTTNSARYGSHGRG
jgi:hypothetical protein